MRLFALLLALAACGDNLVQPTQPSSGSRLKLAWYVYDDGTRQHETTWYYDISLGERCTPEEWSDGHRYCKPTAGQAVYVNDTCTRALGRTETGTTTPPYFATSFHLQGKPLPSRVFRRGDVTYQPLSVWHKHSNGCFGPMEPGDGFEYFELGPEITELVPLHRGHPRGTGELAILDEVSDDGLRVPISVYDRAAQTECTTVDRPNAASIECVPTDTALASYFHEVGCLEPELAISGGDVPATARQYSAQTRCWSYHDVGAEVTAPPLYEALGGTCVSVTPPGGAHFFVMAGPHEMPRLAREREQSTRRLRRIDRVYAETRLEDGLLFDSQLGADCRRDDALRCVPDTDAELLPFFSDEGCQNAIELALVPAGECDPPSRFARKGDDYYPLLGPYSGRFYELSTGDRCGVFVPPTPFVAWIVGPAIDPSTFARAELRIDP